MVKAWNHAVAFKAPRLISTFATIPDPDSYREGIYKYNPNRITGLRKLKALTV